MFFKSIIISFTNSLSGKVVAGKDPLVELVAEELWRPFRERIVEDLSNATVYILDAEAANYADSFREDLQGHEFTPQSSHIIARFIEEVELPSDLVWVEYDHADLIRGRLARGHGADEEGVNPDEFGVRGYLIDNRTPDTLKVMMFRRRGGSSEIVEPIFELNFSGHMSEYVPELNAHVFDYHQRLDISQERFHQLERHELGTTSYDIALPYIVFALIASRENGLELERRESLTGPEMRTARKFSKSWMTERLRTHITVRIGPSARRHLGEQSARRHYEKEIASGRLPPSQHWVSEHERHYKSGKVVLVRAHKRGSPADPDLPHLVVGPRSSR